MIIAGRPKLDVLGNNLVIGVEMLVWLVSTVTGSVNMIESKSIILLLSKSLRYLTHATG